MRAYILVQAIAAAAAAAAAAGLPLPTPEQLAWQKGEIMALVRCFEQLLLNC